MTERSVLVDDVNAVRHNEPMYRHVRIEALTHIMPPHRVSSSTIEEELKDTYERCAVPMGLIEGLVGVKARRFWDEGVTIDGLATDVVRELLVGREHLAPGMIVSTSVCKDYIEPSVAALVAGALDFPAECITFDVANACLGFLTGIDLCARRIESGEIDVAIVLAAESSRHVTRSTVERLKQASTTQAEFRESMPTLTLGSAAVAMLLVHERIATTNHRVNSMVTLGDPKSSRICLGTPEWMKTDGQALLKNGVELAAKTWAVGQEKLGWSMGAVDQFLCHQVGARHMAALTKRLEIPVDRVFLTFPELGNTGPAAVPMAMSLATKGWEHSPPTITDGSRLSLMGIGSGLTVSLMDVTW